MMLHDADSDVVDMCRVHRMENAVRFLSPYATRYPSRHQHNWLSASSRPDGSNHPASQTYVVSVIKVYVYTSRVLRAVARIFDRWVPLTPHFLPPASFPSPLFPFLFLPFPFPLLPSISPFPSFSPWSRSGLWGSAVSDERVRAETGRQTIVGEFRA